MLLSEVVPLKQNELLQQIDDLREKLNRAQRQVSGLRQKSKYLEMQYDDARSRESNSNELVMELLERQRELNVMLNRANIMLNRTQETMALTSMEFNEMAKALPEPKKAEWSDRITKINELFKKTGIQDADVVALENPTPALTDSLMTDELRQEASQAFPKDSSIWTRTERRTPPRVEAELVENEPMEAPGNGGAQVHIEEIVVPDVDAQHDDEPTEAEEMNEDDLAFPPRRKSWWQRLAG